jgi:ElaB/YqjD/DUF883 family membrane-anchored ribosome-binding protein
LKTHTETSGIDPKRTDMPRLLDSIEEMLDEEERQAENERWSVKADQLPSDATPSENGSEPITPPARGTSREIPVLKDVVVVNTMEMTDSVGTRAAGNHQATDQEQAEAGGQVLPTAEADQTDEPGWFSAKLREEVEELVKDVMEEYSQKLLDDLGAKLRERIAYLLIKSKEEKLRS